MRPQCLHWNSKSISKLLKDETGTRKERKKGNRKLKEKKKKKKQENEKGKYMPTMKHIEESNEETCRRW